jgi:ankyrin repeat protein
MRMRDASTARTLLLKGAKINAQNRDGETALMYAVRARDPKKVALHWNMARIQESQIWRGRLL